MDVTAKPDLEDIMLAHFGTKGMKWGVRRGKRTTGISRSRAAIIDRNDRDLKSFRSIRDALKNGGGTRGERFTNTVNRMTMGKKLTEKFYTKRIDAMKSQNARIKSGKLNASDRFRSAAMKTMPLEMLVSIRPT